MEQILQEARTAVRHALEAIDKARHEGRVDLDGRSLADLQDADFHVAVGLGNILSVLVRECGPDSLSRGGKRG